MCPWESDRANGTTELSGALLERFTGSSLQRDHRCEIRLLNQRRKQLYFWILEVLWLLGGFFGETVAECSRIVNISETICQVSFENFLKKIPNI